MSVQIFGGGRRNLSRVRAGENAYSFVISPNGQSIAFIVQFPNGETELRVSDGGEAALVFDVYVPVVRR
jgi:hypothetical protein